jgi:glucose-6-phosphate 1-epimerase
LHSYFAVHDATQVQVAELAGLRYEDKLSGATHQLQQEPFARDHVCDRIYQQHAAALTHHYTLEDRAWQRRIHVTTLGSQSLVVWNPGQDQARAMADVPDASWREFLCLEAANAGADVITLQPGAQHRLAQTLGVEHWKT